MEIHFTRNRLSVGLFISLLALAPLLFISMGIRHIFTCAWEKAHSATCRNNMRGLSMAMLIYSNDWDETLPPAAKWADAIDIDRYLGKETKPGFVSNPNMHHAVFHCPSAPSAFGYGLNRRVAGGSLRSLDDPRNLVLLFETDLPVKNASGSKKDQAMPRHGRFNYGSFCDGHVEYIRTNAKWQ